MTASVASWSMTTSSARCFNSFIITVEFGTNKAIFNLNIFSRLDATKTELVSKIRLVLWLADRMLRLLFIVLAMHLVIPLNFMVKGTPVLFRFFLLLVASDCVNLEAFQRLFLMVLTGNPLCEKNSLISSERLSKVWSLLQILRNLKNSE